MGNIVKKDPNQNPAQPSGRPAELLRFDPFRMLRDPFQIMREMMRDASAFPMLPWQPTFDVRETDDAFVFAGDLPGIKSEDLEIAVTGSRIQISGKRDQEEETTEGMLHAYERSYGSFTRTFDLPDTADVDKVRCDLKEGVLTMVVPKKPGTGQKTRKIQIGSGSKS